MRGRFVAEKTALEMFFAEQVGILLYVVSHKNSAYCIRINKLHY